MNTILFYNPFYNGKSFPFLHDFFFSAFVSLIQNVILLNLTPHPLQANCLTMCFYLKVIALYKKERCYIRIKGDTHTYLTPWLQRAIKKIFARLILDVMKFTQNCQYNSILSFRVLNNSKMYIMLQTTFQGKKLPFKKIVYLA